MFRSNRHAMGLARKFNRGIFVGYNFIPYEVSLETAMAFIISMIKLPNVKKAHVNINYDETSGVS